MVTAATTIQFQHFPALQQPTDLPSVPSRVTQRPTGRPGLIGDAEQAAQVAALLSLLSAPEKKSSRAKQRVGARYSLYKYGGEEKKEEEGLKKTIGKFGARYSLYKYDDGPEKKEDKTLRRVNSINARQSLYKSREKKLERYKANEKLDDFKAQPLPLLVPQEKEDDVNAFNVSIGGDKGRQEYKVSANRSRQRRRKLGLRTDLVENREEKEEVRRESEEIKRVGELVRRRLGEELRRIFREELEGETENMLKEGEKQEKQEEKKERSRQKQGRRKDEAGEEEFEENSLETGKPLSTAAGRLVAPQITIRKRLALPLDDNKVDERRRGEAGSEETDLGERQQEAEARSDVDQEEEERQKYFRRLWSLRQARVSARLKKGRNGAHQNVQKKHQHHHQRRFQHQNGQKKQNYDTGPRRIVQNSLESRFLA